MKLVMEEYETNTNNSLLKQENSRNELLKEVLEDMKRKEHHTWMKELKKDLMRMKLMINIHNVKKDEIKEIGIDWDTSCWKNK